MLSDAEHAERLTRLQALQSIRVLARAVDAKDRSTRQHSERVAEVAKVLADDRSGGRPRTPRCCATPAWCTTSARSPCPTRSSSSRTASRRTSSARVTAHAALGAEIVADVLSAAQVAWVRGHHERWDGRGYPDAPRRRGDPRGRPDPDPRRRVGRHDVRAPVRRAALAGGRPGGVPAVLRRAVLARRRWRRSRRASRRVTCPPGAAGGDGDRPRGESMDLKGNAVTWLGHGTWLWETSEGKRLLIDCWLAGNPATPDEYKDPPPSKPTASSSRTATSTTSARRAPRRVHVIARSRGAPSFAGVRGRRLPGRQGRRGDRLQHRRHRRGRRRDGHDGPADHSGGITGDDGGMSTAASQCRLHPAVPGRPGRLPGPATPTCSATWPVIGEIYPPDVAVLRGRRLLTIGPVGGPRRAADRGAAGPVRPLRRRSLSASGSPFRAARAVGRRESPSARTLTERGLRATSRARGHGARSRRAPAARPYVRRPASAALTAAATRSSSTGCRADDPPVEQRAREQGDGGLEVEAGVEVAPRDRALQHPRERAARLGDGPGAARQVRVAAGRVQERGHRRVPAGVVEALREPGQHARSGRRAGRRCRAAAGRGPAQRRRPRCSSASRLGQWR